MTTILKQDNNDIEGPVVAWHRLDCKPVLCDTRSNLIPTTAPRADIWNPDNYYTWYIHGIYHVYTMDIPSAGIYMVYTTDIPCILKCNFLVFFCILLLWTQAISEDKVILTPENFKKAFSSFKSRQHKSMVYTRYILVICMVYAIHIPGLVISKSCQLSKK